MNVERTTLLIAKLIPEERKISKIFTRLIQKMKFQLSKTFQADITREFLDEINLNSDFLPIPDAAVSYLPCD